MTAKFNVVKIVFFREVLAFQSYYYAYHDFLDAFQSMKHGRKILRNYITGSLLKVLEIRSRENLYG